MTLITRPPFVLYMSLSWIKSQTTSNLRVEIKDGKTWISSVLFSPYSRKSLHVHTGSWKSVYSSFNIYLFNKHMLGHCESICLIVRFYISLSESHSVWVFLSPSVKTEIDKKHTPPLGPWVCVCVCVSPFSLSGFSVLGSGSLQSWIVWIWSQNTTHRSICCKQTHWNWNWPTDPTDGLRPGLNSYYLKE